jgi:hypothetical protein
LLNLTVSANNSNLTIDEYDRFNITFRIFILSYEVYGKKEQSFEFGFSPEIRGLSVLFNDDLMSEGEG